jgi:hypothetical protein
MRKLQSCLFSAVFAAGAAVGFAQDLPTSQPKLLNIARESVKVGRGADHAKFEAGWPAAYEKAKSPYYYLAMSSITGPREVWYVSPFPSHAAFGDSQKREGEQPLAAELERLTRGDAEFLNDSRTMQAAARPDLSHGAYPDLAKMRVWEISIFRIKPGHMGDFVTATNVYKAAATRSAPHARWRAYEAMAGAPGGTFVMFSSYASFADLDQAAAENEALWKNITPEEGATLQKFLAEGVISTESNRFQLDGVQSYVAKATRESDLAFWMPKKSAKAKAPAQP